MKKKVLIDTHVHPLISKKQANPEWNEISVMFSSARSVGLDGVCITEHLESIAYAQLMTGLFNDLRLGGEVENGVLVLDDGFCVFPGCEVQLENGSNIGVHTNIDALLNLKNAAGYYDLPTLRNEMVLSGYAFSLVAHHILFTGKEYQNHVELAENVDVLEIPSKHIEIQSDYQSLAKKLSLPMCGGSDAHTFVQIGACSTEMELGELSVSGLTSAVDSYCPVIRPFDELCRLRNVSKVYRNKLMRGEK